MSENPTKIWIQNLWQKIKAFFLTKEVLIFLFFVLLSGAFWYMNALNIQRKTNINIPINYIGIPENINILHPLPEKLTLVVQDEGKNLYAYAKKNIHPLTIDLALNNLNDGEIRISQEALKSKLSNILRPTTHLIEIDPDTIVAKYITLTKKRLPVRISGNVMPASQYILKEDICLTPESISIYCPQKVAKNINEIYTKHINIADLQDSISISVPLQKIKSVRFSTEHVQLTARAEMFTEKSFTVPIKPINFPDSLNIRTFPADATVTFNVGMSHFNEITANDIAVVFDYRHYKNNTNKGKIETIYNQVDIFNLRIKPNEVEFILEKK